jgi:hypothetical protein
MESRGEEQQQAQAKNQAVGQLSCRSANRPQAGQLSWSC